MMILREEDINCEVTGLYTSIFVAVNKIRRQRAAITTIVYIGYYDIVAFALIVFTSTLINYNSSSNEIEN